MATADTTTPPRRHDSIGADVRDAVAETMQRVAEILAARVYSPRIKLLSMGQITEATGYSRTKVYELMKDGKFPQPMDLPGEKRWSETSIVAWVKSRDPNEPKE